MDILKDEQYKDYNYTSRFSAFPIYYNKEDDKYMYGLLKQLDTENTLYSVHILRDFDTLDSLALKYYGRPDLYWVIAMFNKVNDPFIKLIDKFTEIKIPSLSNIHWSN